jgi:Flp pilus assembly protein TadG
MDQMISKRARGGSDDGVELIELAIVIPILMLLLFGVVDMAFLFQRWEVVTNAAREGARLGSLGDAYQIVDVENRVEDYLAAGGLSAAADIDVDLATQETINSVVVNTVTVTVTYPSDFIFLPGSIDLTSVSTMRSEAGS